MFDLASSKNFLYHNPDKKAGPGTGKLYAYTDHSHTAAWQASITLIQSLGTLQMK
jgi:hypothetical protein